jgi:hypothetical protein
MAIGGISDRLHADLVGNGLRIGLGACFDVFKGVDVGIYATTPFNPFKALFKEINPAIGITARF